MDGDQLVDFYWIDPMVTAERIAAKSKYAGNLYLQFESQTPGLSHDFSISSFEIEKSWDRPGVCAFGRVNGGLVFETAYIKLQTSAPVRNP
jgi:hypothetical protein